MTSQSSVPSASTPPGGSGGGGGAPISSSEPDRRLDLTGLTLESLAVQLAGVVDRPFRVRQIYEAMHRRGVVDFGAMTELSLALRQELASRYRLAPPAIDEAHVSADGTVKVLFQLDDGATIEAVDIPDRGRRTFCVSSQAGCALGCRFCVTGFWGAGRNLTAAEIVGQVRALSLRVDSRRLQPAEAQVGEHLYKGLSIVFMGMGEPLLNPEAVRIAVELLRENIAPRRITLSTVGILPALEQMATWKHRPNLAISLHAPDDERRSRIMPINRTYPLADLLAALARYPVGNGGWITFEYILIRGFNDQLEAADALVRRLGKLPAKVNLIPLNPDPVLGPTMVAPAWPDVLRFQSRLKEKGLLATIRRRRGDEVSGACGQLRAFGRDPRGFRTPVDL